MCIPNEANRKLELALLVYRRKRAVVAILIYKGESYRNNFLVTFLSPLNKKVIVAKNEKNTYRKRSLLCVIYLRKKEDIYGRYLFPHLAPKNWRVTKIELFPWVRLLLLQSKISSILPRFSHILAARRVRIRKQSGTHSRRNPITTPWEIMVVRPTNNPFHSFFLVSREWGSWVVWGEGGMVFRLRRRRRRRRQQRGRTISTCSYRVYNSAKKRELH